MDGGDRDIEKILNMRGAEHYCFQKICSVDESNKQKYRMIYKEICRAINNKFYEYFEKQYKKTNDQQYECQSRFFYDIEMFDKYTK